MKSVHITNYYHRDSGGVSTAYNKLLEAANRHRRYLRLIVPGETSAIEEVGEFGRIYFVKAGYSPVFDKRYRILLPWKAYIFDKGPVKTILRQEKPDIIEVGEKYTLSLMAGLMRKGIMKVSKRRPVLVHYSAERMDDNVRSFIAGNGAGTRFSRWYVRNYLVPMFDFHLANSAYTAQELLDAGDDQTFGSKLSARLLRTPRVSLRERVFVNQCGVDTDTFSVSRKSHAVRAAIVERYSLPDNAKLLLYAGRLSPEKNIDLLPKIMEILAADRDSEFHLLVAGAGPRSAKLSEEFNRATKGKVTMLGNMDDRSALADLFANCDVFVHPNPREPFGITPLEAMASGLPVVAPNSGGLLSYADERNAYLIEPSAERFAEAIRSVVSNPEPRLAKTEAALATAARYTWHDSTDSLFALYDKMHADFTARRHLYDHKAAVPENELAEELSTTA